jgi:CubicO group peptidase (beta-lactamase class C family)
MSTFCKCKPVRALGAAALLSAISSAALASGPTDAQIQSIVTEFAQNALASGEAVGVGVSVIRNGATPMTLTFGQANAATQAPFQPDSLFEIASNSKVFTTNLLGQAVVAKRFALSQTLGSLSREVGALKHPLAGQVTLEELGDFTSGFPDLAPLCAASRVPGCLPNGRPTFSQYTSADFLDFFQNAKPTNYTTSPAEPLAALPGPYLYSNFGVGLLGLILGNPGQSIADTDTATAVNNWYNQVLTNILIPLGMNETLLTIPDSVPSTLIVGGYSRATARAKVADGKISALKLVYAGGDYASAPQVTISGGGGSGAAATATLKNGAVATLSVTSVGSGYFAPPAVTLTGGGSTVTAAATPIVSGGKIVAFEVTASGSGYGRTPKVTITGGRSRDGKDATAVAHIGNGGVTAITVVDGGSGYLDPLEVTIAPGAARSNVVPVWAPAGGLISSLTDMTSFASAALGETVVNGEPVPAALTQGFTNAETAYACSTGPHADLADCPEGAQREGLAWVIKPGDAANRVPKIVTKNGALPGFSSQILLVPSQGWGLVVLVNSDDSSPALRLAFQIGYNLLYAGL